LVEESDWKEWIGIGCLFVAPFWSLSRRSLCSVCSACPARPAPPGPTGPPGRPRPAKPEFVLLLCQSGLKSLLIMVKPTDIPNCCQSFKDGLRAANEQFNAQLRALNEQFNAQLRALNEQFRQHRRDVHGEQDQDTPALSAPGPVASTSAAPSTPPDPSALPAPGPVASTSAAPLTLPDPSALPAPEPVASTSAQPSTPDPPAPVAAHKKNSPKKRIRRSSPDKAWRPGKQRKCQRDSLPTEGTNSTQ